MKTKYLAFAAAAFMLASCSNDEDFVPQDNLKDAPITVTADVADLKTRTGMLPLSVSQLGRIWQADCLHRIQHGFSNPPHLP